VNLDNCVHSDRLRFRAIFENFPRLTIEMTADGFQSGEADGFRFAGFENRQILRRDIYGAGEIVEPHFPLGEDDVQIDDDRHKLDRQFLFFLDFAALVHDMRNHDHEDAAHHPRRVHYIGEEVPQDYPDSPGGMKIGVPS